MEALIIGVGLYLVYVILNKFDPAIDVVVDASNNKAVNMLIKQEAKYAKDREKVNDKVEDLGEVISAKELLAKLRGKTKKAKPSKKAEEG